MPTIASPPVRAHECTDAHAGERDERVRGLRGVRRQAWVDTRVEARARVHVQTRHNAQRNLPRGRQLWQHPIIIAGDSSPARDCKRAVVVVYVCICVPMCIGVCVCEYTHTFICVCVLICVCVYMCVCVFICVCVYVDLLDVYLYACAHLNVYGLKVYALARAPGVGWMTKGSRLHHHYRHNHPALALTPRHSHPDAGGAGATDSRMNPAVFLTATHALNHLLEHFHNRVVSVVSRVILRCLAVLLSEHRTISHSNRFSGTLVCKMRICSSEHRKSLLLLTTLCQALSSPNLPRA